MVAATRRAGEQIEAYAVRSRDVDVKVFDGEVESLAVAEIEGVGIRVIVDHRQGYAWAGSLDPEVVAETLAEARDNAALRRARRVRTRSPTPADFAGVTPPTLDLWRDDVLAVHTADKVALALELDAATTAVDPRVRGVESARLRRRRDRSRGRELARASKSTTRRTMCSISAYAMAGDGDGTQTG